MTDLEKAFAQPSIMKVHVSFSGDEYNAELLEISKTGSMTLRTSPTRLNFVSMRYARPIIGVTKEIMDKFKSKHWDHEHNHLDVDYLKVFDWLTSGINKPKAYKINTELTNDEAKLTKISTIRSFQKINRKPVELSLNF